MIRSVDLLLKSRLISNLASFALLSFLLALIMIGFVGVFDFAGARDPNHPVSRMIGVLLGITLIGGLMVMIYTSWKVLRGRCNVSDYGVFLVITWFIPYLGVVVYLGGSNLIRLLPSRNAAR